MTHDIPRIQFATASDGARIAHAAAGEGPPPIDVPGWVSHIGLEWQLDEARRFHQRLGRARQLIRFDGRGSGLSGRSVTDVGLETHLKARWQE